MHRLRDVWWSGRVDAKLNEIGNHPEDVQIVFLGDSITHFWEKQGINVIRRDFKDYNVLNAGISGDRTQQTIWLIEKSNIFPQVQPKLIVLMIGTNNIGWGETRVPGTTAGIRVILDLLR